MNMKFFYGFFAAFVVILLVSCAGLTDRHEGIFGKSAQKAAKQVERVEQIEKKEAVNADDRLTKIGAWQTGVDYSLNKIQDPPKEVTVAKTINERVAALANKPDFNEVKEVKAIVDGMLSEMKSQKEEAQKSLSKKDEEISKLNEQIKDLDTEKKSEIAIAMKQSESNALKADQYKATLNDMDSFWGFGAITYGFKKLFSRLMWTIIIVGVVFLVLRIAATAYPPAAAVFSIFEMMISWVMNGLKLLAPKAHQISGFVETKVFDGYKKTLTHIIDEIQMLKAKDEGEKDKYTIDDLTTELAKALDTEDKDRIDGIKKELRWK
jgi:hypothetical protein